jgi:hypothetical protein
MPPTAPTGRRSTGTTTSPTTAASRRPPRRCLPSPKACPNAQWPSRTAPRKDDRERPPLPGCHHAVVAHEQGQPTSELPSTRSRQTTPTYPHVLIRNDAEHSSRIANGELVVLRHTGRSWALSTSCPETKRSITSWYSELPPSMTTSLTSPASRGRSTGRPGRREAPAGRGTRQWRPGGGAGRRRPPGRQGWRYAAVRASRRRSPPPRSERPR